MYVRENSCWNHLNTFSKNKGEGDTEGGTNTRQYFKLICKVTLSYLILDASRI